MVVSWRTPARLDIVVVPWDSWVSSPWVRPRASWVSSPDGEATEDPGSCGQSCGTKMPAKEDPMCEVERCVEVEWTVWPSFVERQCPKDSLVKTQSSSPSGVLAPEGTSVSSKAR